MPWSFPNRRNLHYAGNGIKRDAKDRPIFWYQPKGAKTYRVLYADLDAPRCRHAPQVPGAVRIEKASKDANQPRSEIRRGPWPGKHGLTIDLKRCACPCETSARQDYMPR